MGWGGRSKWPSGVAPELAGLPAAEAAWVSDLSSYTRTLGLSPPWDAKQMAEEKESLEAFKGK